MPCQKRILSVPALPRAPLAAAEALLAVVAAFTLLAVEAAVDAAGVVAAEVVATALLPALGALVLALPAALEVAGALVLAELEPAVVPPQAASKAITGRAVAAPSALRKRSRRTTIRRSPG